LLLGTDKRNPVFAVYQDDSGDRLLVFYGFELIEIVNNDSADPAFKLLLARLYNAKVKLSALCESFQVDAKTIRRWGKALLQGDAAELIRVLEGRGVCHKLTPAVENFARLRWPHLVAERSYGAVGRLLLEIQVGNHFGRKRCSQGVQDGQNIYDFLANCSAHRIQISGCAKNHATDAERHTTDRALERDDAHPAADVA